MDILDGDQGIPLIAPHADFGTKLRAYRIAKPMRQKDLGKMLGWSLSLVSMIERGERTASEEFARLADNALSAEGALIVAWQSAAEQAARLPSWFVRWVEVERSARLIRVWQPLVVPGLLQTVDYARTILAGAPGITAEQVEASALARVERQGILSAEGGPMLRAVLDESVLNRPISSEAVTARQMTYLLEMSERPNISVQVLPLRAWLTTGLQGPFTLADGPNMPPMAYMEAASRGQITAESDQVTALATQFDMINGDALSRNASRDLIREAAKQWT